ncbi:MAG: GNAT family N-acetyltransferase [Anaerolineales bacterium]|nr:GNAT family N-acetyltransferase [Anaerolineales bacterium]MDP2777349.1 GNAT family N-acetyltransferase [Anaerolineales bacterium]
MVILETDRLLLRHLVLDDLNELFVLYRDPEIRKYFPEGVLNLEETKEELEWHMNGHPRYPELGLWATIHKKTGRFIGRCGLLPWEIDDRLEVEIAYLLDESFWHQGLATEAVQGILKYGFEKLNLSRLICLIDPENIASQRVAEWIGMTLERKVDGIAGDNFPTLIYSINRK